jgi:hypothetical protein
VVEARLSQVLLFGDRPDLPAPVEAAIGTHPMRRLRLVAMRALAEANGLQRVVGPALGRAGLGMSSFWIRHRLLSAFAIGPVDRWTRALRIVLTGAAPRLQRREARVFPPLRTVAWGAIQIRSALRAQPAAGFAAERLHRQ